MALARDHRARKGQEWGLNEDSLTPETYTTSDSCPLPCSGDHLLGAGLFPGWPWSICHCSMPPTSQEPPETPTCPSLCRAVLKQTPGQVEDFRNLDSPMGRERAQGSDVSPGPQLQPSSEFLGLGPGSDKWAVTVARTVECEAPPCSQALRKRDTGSLPPPPITAPLPLPRHAHTLTWEGNDQGNGPLTCPDTVREQNAGCRPKGIQNS